MGDERENLKGILSQFVDSLIDTEIAKSREEFKQIKTAIANEIRDIRENLSIELHQIQDVKNSLIKEVQQMKEKLEIELLSIRKSQNEFRISSEEFAQKESTLYKHLKTLAIKTTDSLSLQENKYVEMFSKLEERVHRNEDTLYLTRDDHDKLSMVLNAFATGLSTMATSEPDSKRSTSLTPGSRAPKAGDEKGGAETIEFCTDAVPSNEPHGHPFVKQTAITISN